MTLYLSFNPQKRPLDLFYPLRWLIDHIAVKNAVFARLICQFIPCHCPFERDVKLFRRTLFHIPALCKLNPLYDQLMALRWRALTFLVDICQEDVSKYC